MAREMVKGQDWLDYLFNLVNHLLATCPDWNWELGKDEYAPNLSADQCTFYFERMQGKTQLKFSIRKLGNTFPFASNRLWREENTANSLIIVIGKKASLSLATAYLIEASSNIYYGEVMGSTDPFLQFVMKKMELAIAQDPFFTEAVAPSLPQLQPRPNFFDGPGTLSDQEDEI